jgi:hypothetical protein
MNADERRLQRKDAGETPAVLYDSPDPRFLHPCANSAEERVQASLPAAAHERRTPLLRP